MHPSLRIMSTDRGQTDKQTDRQMERWTNSQMDGWMDRQTDRQTDRQGAKIYPQNIPPYRQTDCTVISIST